MFAGLPVVSAAPGLLAVVPSRSVLAEPPVQRAPLRLRTCAPRIGATPKEIVSNPVERLQ